MSQVLFQRVKRLQKPISVVGAENPCTKCSLKRVRYLETTRSVASKVLIVVEATTETDFEAKVLLSGRRGDILKDTLKEFGCPEYDIAAVVKCCPIGKDGAPRSPTASEITRCKTYLTSDLEGYELYILAGDVAVQAVLGEKITVADFGGLVFIEQGKRYLPICAPEEVLKYKDLMNEWRKDIQWGLQVYRGEVPSAKYVLLDNDETIAKFTKVLERVGEAVVDIETTGLNSFKDELLTVGFSVLDVNYLYVVKKRTEWKSELNAFMACLNSVVMHNALFDLKFLTVKDVKIRADIKDTQVLAYLYFGEMRTLKLKTLTKQVLGIRYRGVVRQMGLATDKELYEYNSEDVEYTAKLYEYLWQHLSSDKLRKAYSQFIGNAEYPIVEMEVVGFPIDKEIFMKTKVEVAERLKEIEEGLVLKFGSMNWTSPTQVAELLKREGIDTGKSTPTGKMQVRMDDLDVMAKKLEGRQRFLVESLVEFKELAKLKSTYVDGLEDKIDADWHLRCSYGFTTTSTGRLSASNPNIQSIPRANVIRRMFKMPTGYKLIMADFAAIELRVGAVVFGIERMLEAFVQGIDVHKLTASLVSNKLIEDITKDERQSAKSINFGLLYGASHLGLQQQAESQYGVKMSEREAMMFRQKFFEAYGLKAGHDKQIGFARRTGYAESLFGRRRYLPEIHSGYPADKGHAERQALNTPVQSSASDVNLMTMWFIWSRKEFESLDAKFVATVHDSFYIMVAEAHVPRVLEIIQEVKEEIVPIIQEFVGDVRLPTFEIEVKVGDCWE